MVIFFALSPAVTMKACRTLTAIELPEGTRLVMEKPFGTDATRAEALNDLLARLVPEDNVHRVDHYLGKSTVLNIVGVRFAKRILEPVLNARHVRSLDIVFDESLGLEGRAGYYDGAGALVDMIQSHALQVLSLLAMEAPSTLAAGDLRDGKARVLRATRVWGDDPTAFSRRAKYPAGEIDGRRLPSYTDEVGVDPGPHDRDVRRGDLGGRYLAVGPAHGAPARSPAGGSASRRPGVLDRRRAVFAGRARW